MNRDEWKLVFSKASSNMSEDIIEGIKHNIMPSQETLIAQKIINEIFKAI